jgi:hypothetical protein
MQGVYQARPLRPKPGTLAKNNGADNQMPGPKSAWEEKKSPFLF